MPYLISLTPTIVRRRISRTARPMAGKTSPSAKCVATVGEGGAGQRNVDIYVSRDVSWFVEIRTWALTNGESTASVGIDSFIEI